jgi:hypothetical protein
MGWPQSLWRHVFLESGLLCCRKYKVTATSTNSSFISKHTSTNPNTIKLLVPCLETKENKLTPECTVYAKLQIGLLNAQRTFYVVPCWRVKWLHFISKYLDEVSHTSKYRISNLSLDRPARNLFAQLLATELFLGKAALAGLLYLDSACCLAWLLVLEICTNRVHSVAKYTYAFQVSGEQTGQSVAR